MNLDPILAVGKKLWDGGKHAFGIAAGIALPVLAFLLRRRTKELQLARIQILETKENAENSKLVDDIASLEAKVADDEKERLSKNLLRNVLDDGRGPKPGK